MKTPQIIKYSFHILLITIVFQIELIAQKSKSDSLHKVITNLQTQKPTFSRDTNLVNTLNLLSFEITGSSPDSAIKLSNQALALSEKNGWKIGMAMSHNRIGWANYIKSDFVIALNEFNTALNIWDALEKENNNALKKRIAKGKAGVYGNMGVVNWHQGDNVKAVELYKKSLQIAEDQKDLQMLATQLGNIGLVYWVTADYSNALEYMFRALKIDEKLGNKKGIARHYGNIGNIYNSQKNSTKAIEYHKKALAIDSILGNKDGIARHLGNIGNEYAEMNDYSNAAFYYLESLKIYEEIGNKSGIQDQYLSLAMIYSDRGDSSINAGNKKYAITECFPKSLVYYFKSLEIAEAINNTRSKSILLGNIGGIYLALDQRNKASDYLKKGLELGLQTGQKPACKKIYYDLAVIDSLNGDYKSALKHYRLYIAYRDSSLNEEHKKAAFQKEVQYQFEKKAAQDSVAFIKEKSLKDAMIEKQNTELRARLYQQIALFGGLVLVIIFGIIIFKRYRITQKQKLLIEIQKKDAEQQRNLIAEQHALMEEKNKEITDSIKYAKRIQQAILPSIQSMHQSLRNSFVLYMPKDIVAGDFYWMEKVSDDIFIAAADCTGHGVPGAMVSVICSNALTKALIEENITDTGLLLDRTREIVIEKLARSGEEIKDGMDISLCKLNLKTRTVSWAGANNPIWIAGEISENLWTGWQMENKNADLKFTSMGNKTLIEVKGDKQPVGVSDNPKKFKSFKATLPVNSCIYLFTDGYADQFGETTGKKMKSARMKDLILETAHADINEQKNRIEKAFIDWKGKLEQIDDVCVIGIKFD